jgi:hypothetical protein
MVLLRPADYPTGKVVTSSPSQGWPTVSGRFRDTSWGPPCFDTGHMPQVVSDSAYRHPIWSWSALRLWISPPTACRHRHDAGASPSRLPTRGESSRSGKPGEEHGVFDAGLAPNMHDRELAHTQEPGKCLRAHPQPPMGFGERNQLRRRGDLQGEILLPRGRAWSGTWASGRRWHGQGFPSQQPGRRHGGAMRPTDPNGLGRYGGDSAENLC